MTNYEKYKTPFARVEAFWEEHLEPNDSHSLGGWVEMFSSWLDNDESEAEKGSDDDKRCVPLPEARVWCKYDPTRKCVDCEICADEKERGAK